MNLIHIKLKNGEDILAQENPEKSDIGVIVTAPISVHLDPVHGFFAKSWMALSSTNTVLINSNDIMYCYPASERGLEYYDEFIRRFATEDNIDPEDTNELEQLFEAMMQAKASKLH